MTPSRARVVSAARKACWWASRRARRCGRRARWPRPCARSSWSSPSFRTPASATSVSAEREEHHGGHRVHPDTVSQSDQQSRPHRGPVRRRRRRARRAGGGVWRSPRARAQRARRDPSPHRDLRQQRGHRRSRRPRHAAARRRRGGHHPGSGRRTMLLTPTEVPAIKQQAVAEYPNECCGVVLTRGSERRMVACRNVQDAMHARDPITFPRTARNAYYMDPLDALKLNRLVDEGFDFSVIYHSHPNAGAYFSETDRAQALIRGEPAYPGAVYVVVSVLGHEVKSLAAYRFDTGAGVFERVDAGDLDASAASASTRESRRLLAQAEQRMPGGVNSPVRAFRSVGGEPRFIARGEGARLW